MARLIAAQEDERQRIARELQEDISQRLALLSAEIVRVGLATPADTVVREQWQGLAKTAGDIATDIHRISRTLHPAKLETLGLVAAVGGICQELWHRHGFRVRFTHSAVPPALPSDVALCLYRVVQEALRNAMNHSGVPEADVHLSGEGARLLLRIADTGGGFGRGASTGVGLGLMTMDERVKSIGGRLIVDTASGRGTRIIVKVDLRRPRRKDSAR
jgi:signal transduction histidine kinase